MDVDWRVARSLERMAEALERQNQILARFIPVADHEDDNCPKCGSADVTNVSTMGDTLESPRMRCVACNESWEAMNG